MTTFLIAPTLPFGDGAPVLSRRRMVDEAPTREQIREKGWAAFARCADEDADAMFPDRDDIDGIQYAKRVCAACPVLMDCDVNKDPYDKHAVLAGTTPDERDAQRSRERSARWRANQQTEARTSD